MLYPGVRVEKPSKIPPTNNGRFGIDACPSGTERRPRSRSSLKCFYSWKNTREYFKNYNSSGLFRTLAGGGGVAAACMHLVAARQG